MGRVAGAWGGVGERGRGGIGGAGVDGYHTALPCGESLGKVVEQSRAASCSLWRRLRGSCGWGVARSAGTSLLVTVRTELCLEQSCPQLHGSPRSCTALPGQGSDSLLRRPSITYCAFSLRVPGAHLQLLWLQPPLRVTELQGSPCRPGPYLALIFPFNLSLDFSPFCRERMWLVQLPSRRR